MSSDPQLPTYPILRFMMTRGRILAGGCGLATFLLGLYGALATGHWVLLAAGLGGGVLVGLLLLAFVEVVQIIFDTLVPR